MPNMTLALSPELKKKMDLFPEMNWSEVARKAFVQKVEDMELLNRFREKSTLTKEDALRLGAAANKNIALKLRRQA